MSTSRRLPYQILPRSVRAGDIPPGGPATRAYLIVRRSDGRLLGYVCRKDGNRRTWVACSGRRTTYGIPSLRQAARVLYDDGARGARAGARRARVSQSRSGARP